MSESVQNISEAAGKAQGAVSDSANEIGHNLRDLGTQARTAANRKYEELRDSATDYYQHGKERAQEWEQSLEQYVQEKPLRSVLIAAGIGVVLGLLWKRH
jgi:ElaB/YqjD/DUF883 family membrane-anchored ribosome-binding protein